MTILTDEDSEKVLLNQIILDESIFDEVIPKIQADYFTVLKYKECYELLLQMKVNKKPINYQTFFIESQKKINSVTVDEISNATTSSANWEYYCNNIQTCYQARETKKICGEVYQNISKENVTDKIKDISAKIENVSCIKQDVQEINQVESMIKLAKTIQDMCENQEKYRGLSTGVKSLDNLIGGLKKEYIIIAARTSMGKTFLAQQMALNIAQEHKVAFIELEMSAENINFRNVAMLSGVRMNEIKYGLIIKDRHKFERVDNAMRQLAQEPYSSNYQIVIPKNKNISTISAYIRKAVKKENVECVFIDHVGLIKPTRNYFSAWEGAKEIADEIQDLQRDLDIPIVVLSQRGRSAEGGNQKGDLSTIRGSGAYEENADLIMTIEHDRKTDQNQKEKVGVDSEKLPCEIYISKNRNGTCGVAKCVFDTGKGRFYAVEKE